MTESLVENVDVKFNPTVAETSATTANPTVVKKGCGCSKNSSVQLGPTLKEQREQLKKKIAQRKLFL